MEIFIITSYKMMLKKNNLNNKMINKNNNKLNLMKLNKIFKCKKNKLQVFKFKKLKEKEKPTECMTFLLMKMIKILTNIVNLMKNFYDKIICIHMCTYRYLCFKLF